MTALGGGFGGDIIAAAGGNGDGNFLPLAGFELAFFERVPFFLVGLDKADGFLVGPGERLGFLGG